VHVVQVEVYALGITWMTKEPVIVRATVEVGDPNAGSSAVRTIHMADYAVDEWSEEVARLVAGHTVIKQLSGSVERIEPVISGEEW
jgi:hypothetical protein